MRTIAQRLPWKSSLSVHENDGPEHDVDFAVEHVRLRVSVVGGVFGIHSGRACYRVECLSCATVIHPSTTSATIRVVEHVISHRASRT